MRGLPHTTCLLWASVARAGGAQGSGRSTSSDAGHASVSGQAVVGDAGLEPAFERTGSQAGTKPGAGLELLAKSCEAAVSPTSLSRVVALCVLELAFLFLLQEPTASPCDSSRSMAGAFPASPRSESRYWLIDAVV